MFGAVLYHGLRHLVLHVIRLVLWLVLGVEVNHGDRLPNTGPVIVVANHNSHLDALVLMSLFPSHLWSHLRPIAAADYFLENGPVLAWFARRILQIIPVQRQHPGGKRQFLKDCGEALDRGQILILFPEGTRGEPEQLSKLRSGVACLAKRHPQVPIVPIFLYGLGRALPKGSLLLVPFICQVRVGQMLHWTGHKQGLMEQLGQQLHVLATEDDLPTWR